MFFVLIYAVIIASVGSSNLLTLITVTYCLTVYIFHSTSKDNK